ncbi:MAG: sulfotransferase [Gammaproteobacteria bacterium]|nr:sulfotransferase [Gammaproteobacteria bacterium]
MEPLSSRKVSEINQRFVRLQQLLGAGDYETVITESRQLAQQPPLQVAARALEAMAHAFKGDGEAAVALLKQIPEPEKIQQHEVLLTIASAWMRLNVPRRAIPLFRATLKLKADHPLAHARLGAMLLATGAVEKAMPHLQKALEALPHSSGVRLNLARAYLEQKQPEQALAILPPLPEQKEKDGDDELYELTRNEALFALDREEEASSSLREFSKKASAESLAQSVNLLSSRGQYDQAVEVLREGIERYPDAVELLILAADLAEVRGRFGEAGRWLRLALEKQPEEASVWSKLALLSGKRLSLGDAVEAAEKAMSLTEGEGIKPSQRALALSAKAHITEEGGDLAQAEVYYRQALQLLPSFSRALTGLGQLLMQLGRVEEAVGLFEQLKDVAPFAAWSHLINARQLPDDPDILEQMDRAARRPSLEGPVRSHLLFTLASAWEKKGEYDKAWALATEANAATKTLLPYSAEDHRKRIEREMARFSSEFITSRNDFGDPSEVPVFILGMPRSGTTLVEQILGSHSQVFGAGELSLIPQQIQKLEAWEFKLGSGRHYPECIDDMTAEESRRFAQKLLAELQAYDPDAKRVVDKLPHNFEHIGLIKLLFPNARILHLKREPRDVAMSNYFIDYGAKFGGMGFAYDLTSIGEQLVDHQRLLDHWHQVFPGQILEVDYDLLVEDVEGWAHQIIEYLGLEWEPGVLAFQELDRAVKTASVWQVRQPVYTTSKAKWKRYESHLEPLNSALAQQPEPPEMMAVPAVEPGLFLKGMAALQQGEGVAAENIFRQLLEIAPDHAAGIHFLGGALFMQGKLDEASEAMNRSIKRHRGHRTWLENLLKVEQARGDSERVEQLQKRLERAALTPPPGSGTPPKRANDAVTATSWDSDL